MNDTPSPAVDAPDRPTGLAEVSRLANILAERMLADHVADRDIPDEHIRALAGASRLLAEYGREVPPLLAPILDQLQARAAGAAEAPERAEGEQD